MSPAKPQIQRSLKLLQIESILASLIFAMPILNVFYAKEIGMSMEQVGLSQAIFTVAVISLNIPMGWLADRFSRKWANIIGDAIVALSFGIYACATTFTHIVISEILVGIGFALTTGADTALLRTYCHELGKDYSKIVARLATIRPIASALAMVLGGVVGAINPRLALILSTVTFGVGALLSCFIVDAGARRVSQTHAVKDMLSITSYSLKHRPLAWRIAAFAVSREITHPIVWILTPLLIFAGVPAWLIGASWAINLGLASVGAWLAGRKFALNLRDWQKLAIGFSAALIAIATLAWSVNLATISIYGLLGLTYGWVSAFAAPLVQKHTPHDIQTTVISIADNASRILYVPLVWGIGILANVSLQTALVGCLLVFAPLALIICQRIYALERR